MTLRATISLAFLIIAQFVFAQTKMIILGTAQDGGYPQMGCIKDCCVRAHANDTLKQFVVSLALADFEQKKWWLFEATPDIREQLRHFAEVTNHQFNFLPDGIFITHAHMGHYTGLVQLGREVMNSTSVSVYTLPRLKQFLETNGPWSQLVKLNNITPVELHEETPIGLNDNISVSAFRVPHRDEFSETAGFKIITKEKRYLFIPDIDKWSKWNKDIVSEVKSVDEAYLDASFFSADELTNRKMSEVPHPLVSETMDLFKSENAATKKKIYFIHFNHTNALLYDVEKQNEVKRQGFSLSRQSSIK